MKTRQELEKCRQPWPPMMAAEMQAGGCLLEPVVIEDEHGVYSTGCFHWKGKFIVITIDGGLWHLSASTNHTIGYYELKELRYEFLPDQIYFAQIFPPRSEFVNLHENCFHLWQLAPGAYAECPADNEQSSNDNE